MASRDWTGSAARAGAEVGCRAARAGGSAEVSRVTFHVLHVTCYMSHVTCYVSRVTLPGQAAAVGEGHELGGVARPRRDDGGPAAHPVVGRFRATFGSMESSFN